MNYSLELLSDYEVELASAVLGIVESPAPVYAEQADHGEEHAHADTGGTLDLERVEVADILPAVSSFEEEQGEDSGAGLEDHGIPQLDSELVVDVT